MKKIECEGVGDNDGFFELEVKASPKERIVIRDFTGITDINGVKVLDGDNVVCWDGTKDRREVTEILSGTVRKVEYSDETQFEVDGNNLALYSAENVEVCKDV
jgi:hypothetical protein